MEIGPCGPRFQSAHLEYTVDQTVELLGLPHDDLQRLFLIGLNSPRMPSTKILM
jgi:hypothetical protein